MTEARDELPHYAKKLLTKLDGGRRLLRTTADTDEALSKGGGYLYTILPDNKKASPASSKMLIDRGLLVAQADGLFDDIAQTYAVAANG